MNMDSAKVTSEEKVDLCKKYFYVGCLFLPFVWGVNAVWFYKEAFLKPQFPGQSTIKKLVIARYTKNRINKHLMSYFFLVFLEP